MSGIASLVPGSPDLNQRGRGVHLQRVAVASAVALFVTLGVAVVQQPLLAVAVPALVVAAVAPRPTLYASLGWIMLCRPGQELVQVDLAGLALTEIEGLIVTALVASASLGVRSPGFTLRRRWFVLALAWPAWLVVRSLLPSLGSQVATVSPIVDLRLLEAYALLVPLAVVSQLRGARGIVHLLLGTALVACAIALVTWVLFSQSYVPAGEWSVVHTSVTDGDVRPGGELVIGIALVYVLLAPAASLAGRRGLLVLCMVAELAVSKTLSLVLAVGAAATVVWMTSWRTLRPAASGVVLLGLLLVVALGSGLIDPGGRYDVGERLGETSGQYRASEARTIGEVLLESPVTLLVGAGVGTEFAFSDPLVYEVKRDTHSVLLNVAAKSGLIGVGLFLFPFVWAGARAVRSGNQDGLALGGSLVAVFVISLTVPFWWTVAGMTAALALVVAAAESRVDTGTPAPDPDPVDRP